MGQELRLGLLAHPLASYFGSREFPSWQVCSSLLLNAIGRRRGIGRQSVIAHQSTRRQIR